MSSSFFSPKWKDPSRFFFMPGWRLKFEKGGLDFSFGHGAYPREKRKKKKKEGGTKNLTNSFFRPREKREETAWVPPHLKPNNGTNDKNGEEEKRGDSRESLFFLFPRVVGLQSSGSFCAAKKVLKSGHAFPSLEKEKKRERGSPFLTHTGFIRKEKGNRKGKER